MASFVYAVWSITNVASVHCSVRPEISPCTCEPIQSANRVELSCEKVDSFNQIVDALSNKFEPNLNISLMISHSQLDDLEMRSFSEMNLNVKKLRMISDNLRSLPEMPFRGLSNIEYLSLAENELEEIPKHVLNHLPKISTLDLGKGRIRAVQQDDFKGVPNIRYLILVSNNISRLDKGAFPTTILSLHLGRNQIQTLNGTLRDLNNLRSLFINMNNISTLENELPTASSSLKMILALNNSLEKLPQTIKQYPNLESLFFQNNKLKSLDGVFKYGKRILWLYAFHNKIEYLAEDEFRDAELMEELDLSYNCLQSLNRSLLPLKSLQIANFSFNNITEFSMNEVRGLEHLRSLDLSFNKIEKLIGKMENLIEPNSFLVELRLHYNKLKSLDGALVGLNKLRILHLTHNEIETLLPSDFVGLENLEVLDVSFNQLVTLEGTSMAYLPSMKILKAAYNNLTSLENDFNGLPVLCSANLTYNQISYVSPDLVSKTRCTNHGVPGKLELWLEYNPIMCDERLSELCTIMDSQETRIRGKSHCVDPPPQQEMCTDPPIILKAPLPLIPQIIQTQLHQVGNPAIVSQPSLVQVIVAPPGDTGSAAASATIPVSPVLQQPRLPSIPTLLKIPSSDSAVSVVNSELPKMNSTENDQAATSNAAGMIATVEEATEVPIIMTTTQVVPTISSNVENSSTVSDTVSPSPSVVLAQLNSLSASSTTPTSTTLLSIDNNNSRFDYSTIEYVPIFETAVVPDSVDKSLISDSAAAAIISTNSDDNSVHEQFSPVVLPPSPDSSQLLLIPDEPPETP